MFFQSLSNGKRRLDLMRVFSDTKKTIESTPELLKAVEHSQNTLEILSVKREIRRPPVLSSSETTVSVTTRRTMEAALHLKKRFHEDRIAVLNFANAYTPGGGVTSGATAQEECLCRVSTLYPVLTFFKAQKEYYQKNARDNSLLQPMRLVYAEDIVVFKSDTDTPALMDKNEWFTCDVITAAAPDLRDTIKDGKDHKADISEEALYDFHLNMALNILMAAYRHEVKNLILGAFGCGVFLNPPSLVARAYREALLKFKGVMSNIEFAVYCGADRTNYEVFLDELGTLTL